MDIQEIIEKRLTTLHYSNKKIADEDLNAIIDTALLAPSAKNRQPWRFYILSGKQKDDIVKIMRDWKNDIGISTTVKRTARVMGEASDVIIIYSDKWDQNMISRLEKKDQLLHGEDVENMVVMYDYFYGRIKSDCLSIGGTVTYMILKATELGIDTTWICDVLFMDKDINKYLKLEDKELICALALGYKSKEPVPKNRHKKQDVIIGEENERRRFCK
ncbi:MAG: nitroreductase family protein [Oscillospiraceae bacterium]|nr:nitroreductase family protein [Oscillospiraceae bacterium]